MIKYKLMSKRQAAIESIDFCVRLLSCLFIYIIVNFASYASRSSALPSIQLSTFRTVYYYYLYTENLMLSVASPRIELFFVYMLTRICNFMLLQKIISDWKLIWINKFESSMKCHKILERSNMMACSMLAKNMLVQTTASECHNIDNHWKLQLLNLCQNACFASATTGYCLHPS